ncbi:hypothetical protein [Microlunatus antarcticus]|uniref:Putative membrane protein n=1 Tax=Microlunatus antarcticus TaxID=53388 RepID=A0A7W5JRY5_9ACTN|nr:hypothetical protein [Microlunatus antarcticus]MBB3325153.1 putative membrane protein [Microlunatus antarcticus]
MTNQLNELDDVRRTAAVAADYTQLQGLINASTGVGFALWALGQPGSGGVVIGIGAAVGVAYYRRRYGRAVGRASLLATLAFVLAAFVLCLVGYVLDRLAVSPVLLLPLLAAVSLAAGYRLGYRHVGVTRAHWAAVALLVLGSLTPLVGLDVLGPRTGVLLLGAAMVVIGLADHVRLVAAMKPVPRD